MTLNETATDLTESAGRNPPAETVVLPVIPRRIVGHSVLSGAAAGWDLLHSSG